nr:MAG: hypothetical protein 1 [Dicistroviridae sp.]
MACLNSPHLTVIRNYDTLNIHKICAHTFFGMIIFDEKVHNFLPTVEVLRQYIDGEEKKFNDLIFSTPKEEILPLANVLSSLFFDEIFDELIFELPMRVFCLFPEDFDFQNEGRWFQLMDQWKEMTHANVNKLILSGDVEQNPGPVHSRPVKTQNNDPRVTRLEIALARSQEKIRTLMRTLQRAQKRPHAQMHPEAQAGKGFLKNAKTIFGKLSDMPDGECLTGVADNIERITNFLDQMLPTLQENFQHTGLEITDKLISIKDDMIKVIVLVILIKLFMKFKKYRLAVAIVLIFMCQHYGMHTQIVALVKELLEKVKKPTAQMETEEVIYSPLFQHCGKILFAILAFICVKKIPGKQDWDTYLTRLDRIPKSVAGAQKIYDFTTEYWNLAHDTIKMMVLGKSREELRSSMGIYTEIEEWAAKIRKYLDLKERDKIDVDVVVAAEVEKLWKQGLEFKADKLLSREADKLVQTMLLPARALFEYVSASPIKGGGPRMRPVCVWLCGASGIGKTEMIYPLCIDVLREMGLCSEHDYQHQVYARQVETEYWDGYKGAKIVIYDDAFQKKDDRVTGNPEIFEVIRSCNTFPQHLHMAALHDKNTFSAAELMLYTTNEMNVEIASLTHPDAFDNRMYENAYVVTPKEPYRRYEKVEGQKDKICLDLEKIDRTKAIDLSIYQFQKMNKNNEEVGEPIGYEEFSKMISTQWRQKKEDSMRKLRFLEEYATRPKCQMEEFHDCEHTLCDFASDISTRIAAGETMEDIEYYYASDDRLFDDYRAWKQHRKPVNKWQKYIDRCEVVMTEFKGWMQKLKDEAGKIVREHPYLSMLGLVGVALSMFGLYHMLFTEETEERPLAEITASGDVRTIRQTRPLTEIASSGDFRTQKQVRPKVEGVPVSELDIEGQKQYLETVFSHSLLGGGVLHFMKKYKLGIYSPKYVTAEIAASGDVRTQKQVRVKVESDEASTDCDTAFLADFVNGKAPQAQGCSDPQALLLVTDFLFRNTYKMTCKLNGNIYYIGNVTFLKGWVAAMPYHFLSGLALRNAFDGILTLTQDGVHDTIQFPVSYLIEKTGDQFRVTSNVARIEHISGGDQDCVVVCLHKLKCQPHKSIMAHIVKQDDLKMMTGAMKGTMSTFHRHQGQLMRMYHTFGEITAVDQTLEIDLSVEFKKSYLQRSYYTYRVSTAEGDCGSVIGIFSKRMTRKLIGMHIAGDSDGIAYACPWTFERLENAIKKLEAIHGPVAQMQYAVDHMVDTTLNPKMPEGDFVPVGKSKLRVGQAVKSTLVKSRIYEQLRPATMAPSILRPMKINGVLVDPLLQGLKKCGVVPALLNFDDLNACVNDISRMLRTNFCGRDVEEYRRVLTYEESIRGTGDEYMGPKNRLSSGGFRYNQEKGNKPGQTKWFGANEFYDFESEDALEMRKDVDTLIEDCRNGIIRGVYCVDTLKDEKRDLEKVAAGKTRVFSVCPAHFVTAFRQYFLGFSAWCMHNRIDNEIAVGTNQYSLDWTKVALRLKMKGTAVIAGDFSNYDGSLNAQVLWAILDIVNDWYNDGEENVKIRNGLWAHVVHSTHVFEDNVYMWTHSQPSGNPFTVIINSIYNSIIMRMAWRIVMESSGKAGMDHFQRHVSMVSYGDDNVLNISREVIDEFNQQTIADALASIAHTYTDEGKTGEIVKFRNLSEVNFLKRRFVFSEEIQRYVAPLEERVIYEMLNWARNTVDPDEILVANVRTAAREMALHGREKFDKFCKEIRHIENKFRIPPQMLTYAEYMSDMKMNAEDFFD